MTKINFHFMIGLSGLGVGLMGVMSGVMWGLLPAEAALPVHWNALGQPDRYGGKFEGLLLLPLMTLGLVGLLAWLPRWDKRLEESASAYQITWGLLLGLMFLFHGGIIATLLGYTFNLTAMVMAAIGVMFGVMGYTMPQIRPNKLFGIRTPWTLASDYSWAKTHQLGGKLFMGLGLLTTLSALISSLVAIAIMVGGLLVSLPLVMIYSYWWYKQDLA